ncbi:MAG TPA: glycosyltransferase 87 family protein [Ktedonobacterales bacterium]|nr:glycosyltransferase 87 family protein [Ktedonobacterales bacterium]
MDLQSWGARARSLVGTPRVALPRIAALAIASWLAAQVINLTHYGASVRNGDVLEYQRYAMAFWFSAPLFRHLPVEYPPLTILPFTLTILPPLPDPVVLFEWWMGALLIVTYFWFRRYSTPRRAVVCVAYLLIGATSTVLARYDLFPALATLLALWACERGRFRLAYGLLAVGVLLKLYPAFLIPIVAVQHWRTLTEESAPTAGGASSHAWRGSWRSELARLRYRAGRWLASRTVRAVANELARCVGIIVVGFAVAGLLSPAGALSGFTYAGARPLQIESTPATLLWVASWFGVPVHSVYTFHSLNLVGPLDVLLKPLSAFALAGGCALVYWRLLRGRLAVGQAFVACLCVVLVTNKIFSPQYLIWVLPLVAYVMGLEYTWIAIGVLTTMIYPFIYFAHPHIRLVAYDPLFLPALALRNVLLLYVTVRVLRAGARATPAPAAAGADAPRAIAR